jgi:ribosomal protein S27AE
MTACQSCGGPLPKPKGGPPRKFCSKACANAWHRVLVYARNRERIKAKSREYSRSPQGMEAQRRRESLPTRQAHQRAMSVVNHAVRDRKISKPKSCSRCGKVGPVQGHHENYERPLEVRWLCSACHGAITRKVPHVATES